ncbi:MAG UNVERIFIED_CONTAM: hypothetical protein LVR18_47415 [Planctomycetaceae bacterium]
MVGLSGDQIFQRRPMWKNSAGFYEAYATLKWSFFYVALNWDDAEDCLAWARDEAATVSEMRAWRKAQRGVLGLVSLRGARSGIRSGRLRLGAADARRVRCLESLDPSEYVPKRFGWWCGHG